MALIIETLLSTGPLPTPPERAVRACLEVRITKNFWLIFRDYAILPGMGYTLKVKLTEAKCEGKTVVPIFPKRDVIEG